jgi:Secretion system C-terminal sorting domain
MIRTLLVLALLAMVLTSVQAQDTFTWEPTFLEGSAHAEEFEFVFPITLTNTTDQERVYVLEWLDETPDNLEWSRSWCTHGFCFAPFFQSVNDTLAAQQTDPDCHIQVGFTFLNEDFEPEIPDTLLYLYSRVYDFEFPDNYIDTVFELTLISLDVEEGSTLHPVNYRLEPVYPNPFNAQATINFSLPAPGNATLNLFDVTGRQVATLSDGFFTAGSHQVTLLANQLGSGTYFLRLNAGDKQFAQRVTLVK